MDTLLTADLVVESPRFRRKSSTWVDAIHDLPEKTEMAPAQLYSTESGRLFHSGKICLVTVGLPARGKTHMSVAIARYLRWLGVKTRVFHLGDYRRAATGPGKDVPDDYFWVNASPSSVLLRQKILRKCREDIYTFFQQENGQIAIYDAVNPLAQGRRWLAKEMQRQDIQTLFIESFCDDQRLIEENVRSVKISSPDYVHWNADEAVRDYLKRINAKIPDFETMNEKELNYVKMINAGERLIVNNRSFGYLSHRIVFYLNNLHIKSRYTYFVRAGTTGDKETYKSDSPLSEEGIDYSSKMTKTLLAHREKERQIRNAMGGPEQPARPLIVWTSTRRRTMETAQYLQKEGFSVRHRSLMSALNPGVCERMSERRIRHEMPVCPPEWRRQRLHFLTLALTYPKEEVTKHEADPYHHRYPRAESYHDLAVRLEPIILELERERNDLLIIAHESVLRVLYGYLMACNAIDIPTLSFPRNEIIEIIPASYQNEAKRIAIPNLPKDIIPPSPEDIRIPVPSSGLATPSTAGMLSPVDGSRTPQRGSTAQKESADNAHGLLKALMETRVRSGNGNGAYNE